MSTNEDVKNLLGKLQQIKSVNMQDNIFSVLEITDKEVFHSRFLRYLIENDWKGFCEKALKYPELGADKNVSVECEYHCEHLECMQSALNNAKDGRIDILCQTDSAIVAIEVKWKAEDQSQQLLRYRKRLEALFQDSNKEIILVYLTLSGKPASAGSVKCSATNCPLMQDNKPCEVKKYVRISFADIKGWIENKTDGIIKQYFNVLQEEYNMEKIVTCITENERNYFAANEVASAITSAKNEVRGAFLKALDKKIRAEFPVNDISNVAPDKLKYGYDKNFANKECLAYLYKGNYYLLIWATTYLYWQLGKSCKYEKGDKWSYINTDWFASSEVKEIDTVESKGNKKKVDAKYLSDEGNEIVELYFRNGGNVEKMKEDRCMSNIVNNMKNNIYRLGL